MAKLKTWREIPIGGVVLEGGTAEQYLTGGWRTLRPVKDEAKCTNCMICWVYCPDTSILAKDGKMVGFDLEHCKGCGICAMECPVKVEAHAFTGKPGKVIQMVEEAQFRSEG
jgi:pyruvate ferredoxin oxidoreductase delta subunit